MEKGAGMESAVREVVRRRKAERLGKLPGPASRPARAKTRRRILWEGEPGEKRALTYQQLHREVCRFANVLKRNKIRKGDRVIIYMPTIPEAAIAMLACARIGAVAFGRVRRLQRATASRPHRGLRGDSGHHRGRRLPPRRDRSAEEKRR